MKCHASNLVKPDDLIITLMNEKTENKRNKTTTTKSLLSSIMYTSKWLALFRLVSMCRTEVWGERTKKVLTARLPVFSLFPFPLDYPCGGSRPAAKGGERG